MADKGGDGKPATQSNEPLTSRQRKRMKRKQYLKELKRQNVYDENRAEQYEAADYYFENGLRKVYPYHFTFTTSVQEKWNGRPILEVFAEQFQSNTEENYKKAIEEGHLRVNGEAVGVDYCLKPNDVIVSRIHRHENPVADEKMEVIHEDKDVLVVNKPASIPCQPCGRYRFNSMVFILCKELGLPSLRNIYRLDWQTSGVMMCGKTKEKATILEHQIQNGFVTKEYVCRVQGEFPLGVVTLDRPIVCVSHRLFLWKVMPNGKPSKTVFERMSFNGTSSVVKCIPQALRTAHHIRVHLQYLGYPILNDPVYNSEVWGPNKGKAGVYQRPDSEVIKDVLAIHRVGLWTDQRNPILDLRMQAERSRLSNSEETSHTCCQSSCECPESSVPQSDRGIDSQTEKHRVSAGEQLCCNTQCSEVEQSVQTKNTSDNSVSDFLELSKNKELPNSHQSSCPGNDKESSEFQNVQEDSLMSEGSEMDKDPEFSDAEDIEDDSLLCSSGNVLQSPSCEKILSQSGRSSVPGYESVSNLSDTTAASSVENSPPVRQNAVEDDLVASEPLGKRLKLDCNGTDSNVATGERSKCDSKGQSSGGQSPRGQSSGERSNMAVSRPGFDIDKWVPDPHCAECTKTYIDPDPLKLVIYLHGLRYKGPGWEYSTKLPVWAEEDWQGE